MTPRGWVCTTLTDFFLSGVDQTLSQTSRSGQREDLSEEQVNQILDQVQEAISEHCQSASIAWQKRATQTGCGF